MQTFFHLPTYSSLELFEYPMANLTGVIASIFISLTAFPAVYFAISSTYSSDPLWLTVVACGSLLLVGSLCAIFLKPNHIQEQGKLLEKRGLLYYTCCVFMWSCTADIALQSHHLGLFGLEKSTLFFEAYLQTPFGTACQWWNAIVNYCFYVVIIFQIDNHINCKNVALYWASNMLGGQFVVMGGCLSGFYSDQLEYSSLVNVVFIAFSLWVLYHFLTKPEIKSMSENNSKGLSNTCCNLVLGVGLLMATVFNFYRGLGAFGSKIFFIKWYVDQFEPYIKDPALFGSCWVVLTAVYGIPIQLVAIYGLLNAGCKWMLDLSIMYAGAILQGTFMYLIYSWFPSSEPKYRIPQDSLFVVMFFNVFLIFLSHCLMFRCLKYPAHFLYKSTSAPMKKKKH